MLRIFTLLFLSLGSCECYDGYVLGDDTPVSCNVHVVDGVTCQNGGTATPQADGSVRCFCHPEYTGDLCENCMFPLRHPNIHVVVVRFKLLVCKIFSRPVHRLRVFAQLSLHPGRLQPTDLRVRTQPLVWTSLRHRRLWRRNQLFQWWIVCDVSNTLLLWMCH